MREKAPGDKVWLQLEATAGQGTSWVWVENIEHVWHGLGANRAKVAYRLPKAFAQVGRKPHAWADSCQIGPLFIRMLQVIHRYILDIRAR